MKKDKKRITILNIFGIKSLDKSDTIMEKLREEIDINTVDSGGRTLLMEAIIRKNHELAKLLIENGADVNIQDNNDWSALHFAAQEYDLISTELLVQNGANVNSQNDYGNSIISTAVFNSRGQGEVIELLINEGADVNLKNKSGISALDLAKTISNYNVIQFFD